MTYSKGPWIYDAESGAVYTKDRTGYWGPDHYPVEVCAVAALDGVNNGPLLAASNELLEALRSCVMVMERDLSGLRLIQPELKEARAVIAKLEESK